MRRKLLVSLCGMVAAVGMAAAPAHALFDFHFGSITSTWDGVSSFTAGVNPALTSGSLTRIAAPSGTATFVAGSWGLGGDFSIAMTLSGITATTANATGTFVVEDVDGDTITGNVSGSWLRVGPSNVFNGVLSNVFYNDNSLDGTFDAHIGSVPMSFTALPPWFGALIQLSTAGTWFTEGSYTTDSGSVDASVVPAPGAALLGLIGLGVIGWARRRIG